MAARLWIFNLNSVSHQKPFLLGVFFLRVHNTKSMHTSKGLVPVGCEGPSLSSLVECPDSLRKDSTKSHHRHQHLQTTLLACWSMSIFLIWAVLILQHSPHLIIWIHQPVLWLTPLTLAAPKVKNTSICLSSIRLTTISKRTGHRPQATLPVREQVP